MTETARRRLLLAMAAVVVILLGGSLGVGEFRTPIATIADALVRGITGLEMLDNGQKVVWFGRLPTALTALLAGASLGAAGLLMQTFFRNPLAGPDVMGVSAGASLGVALVTLAKGSEALLPTSALADVGTLVSASAGAFGVLLLALAAARWYGDALTLLVLGLMFAALASGVVGMIAVFARSERLQEYVQWTFGSFFGSWERLPVFGGMVATGLVASILLVKPLNVLQLGPEYAQALGVQLRRTRVMVLGSAAILTGATTAVCGPIAFLGIAAPHLARIAFRTSDHRWLLPGSILIGAVVALSIDLAAKVIARPAVLPVNTVSGVLGAPFVIWIVLRWRPRA